MVGSVAVDGLGVGAKTTGREVGIVATAGDGVVGASTTGRGVATAVFPSPSSSTNSIAFESSPRRGVHSTRTCLAPRLLTLLWRLVGRARAHIAVL
jgi:hypothetical protein